MSRLLWASLTLGSLLLAGCGSNRIDFSGQHRAAPPVNLSVYVNGAHLRLSPGRVGAGAVAFNIANQASHPERVVITRRGRTVARTRPISARSTAQLTVAFTRGQYEISARQACGSCAPRATSITPALLRIGPARTGGDAALLQP